MIKPNDIVLTRLDRFKILMYILDDMIPWQIPVFMVVLMVLTNTLLINTSDWYHNLSMFRHFWRFVMCLPLAFLELCGLLCLLEPIEQKIRNRWDRFEPEYREKAVKEVDEFLLSKRENTDDEATENY